MITYPKNNIIRLQGAKKLKLQLEVLERDNFTCQTCGVHTESPPHHVIFASRGGSDVIDNMVSLCFNCHHGFHGGAKYKGWVEDGKFKYREIKRKEKA